MFVSFIKELSSNVVETFDMKEINKALTNETSTTLQCHRIRHREAIP